MPVQFRRDEFVDQPPASLPQHDGDSEGGGFGSGLIAAIRPMLAWVFVGAILFAIGLRLMKPALVAADKLFYHGQGAHWQEMWMPVVLFMFFGAIFGALVAWRLSARTGLDNVSICLAVGLGTFVLAAVGAIAGTFIFAGAIPSMCWFCLGGSTLAAVGGAFGLTQWTG